MEIKISMILKWFLKHQWKESLRSSIWQRNLAANIAIGFLVVLMFLYLLMLGIFIDPILRKLFPDDDPAGVFNSVILYYLMFDLFFRYLMQGLPVFSIESYLHLPIRKSSVVHFVTGKTAFHLLNFLPLLVFIPFSLTTLISEYKSVQVLAWIISVFFLILNDNFLATYLKRQLVSKPLVTGMAGIILLGLVVSDYFGLINLSKVSRFIFGYLLEHPWLTIVPLALLATSYSVHYRFLKARMYPEEVIKRKTHMAADLPRIKYLDSLGLTGDIIRLEMKLWLRHRRTKSMIYLLPIFILYGFFFYPMPQYKAQPAFFVFVGTFMTGGFMMNYLNYAFGYESSYFDGILTRKIDMGRYIRAKFTVGILICSFCYIVTIPYVFFGYEILLVNTVTYLFNVGVISFILLFMATYNKKRMDLSKGASFNYQGVGLTNWLVLLPAFLLPLICYKIFSIFGSKFYGLAIIGILGLIGFFFRKYWIGLIEKNFHKRRYTMAEGFREGT